MNIWEKIKDWLSIPSCPKHGTEYMYEHGWEGDWDCEKCRRETWMERREDYLK